MKDAFKYSLPDEVWAGTEHSLTLALEGYNAFMAAMQAGVYDNQDATEPDVPYNFTKSGDVGVISIRGALVNKDSPWLRYYGLTSYADISRAMIYAASQADVGAIVLDIDSGGGAVSGVADTADLIAMVNKDLKPVYAYSGGVMASAAYWLGSSAREVFTSKTTLMGSIGVITTHMEYSKALKEQGVGVTVVRAGKYKALANSVEPLSDKAKEEMQAQLDAAYEVFATHVAKQRGVSMETFEATMGQGREFFGTAAVDAGLAKSVKTFDGVVSLVQKAIDTNAKKVHPAGSYHQGSNMPRQALTEQQVAALAAGGTAQASTQAEADAAAQAAAAEAAQAAEAAAQAAAQQAANSQPAAEPADTNAALVTLLQAQVKEKDGALLTANVELTNLKAKLAGVEATHGALVKIAAESVSNMKVALGLSKVDLSAMAPELLVAEHAATQKTFAEKFAVGGVAAVSSEADASASTQPSNVRRLVQANRIPTRK